MMYFFLWNSILFLHVLIKLTIEALSPYHFILKPGEYKVSFGNPGTHNRKIRYPRKMKQHVVAAVFCVLALSLGASALEIPPEMKEILEAAHTACIAETGVSPDVAVKAGKGVLDNDPKLKCFLKCMLQKLQAMGDDGTLNFDLIEASLPAEMKELGAVETLKKCASPSNTDLCEAAFEMLNCVNKSNPQLAHLFN